MDQDGDGVNGEALDDQFTFNFNIDPIVQRFDFGTAASPVAADHTQVTNFTAYSPANGFGYLAGNVQSIDRFVGSAATRDLNYASSFTFAVDVQNGAYEVEISFGDTGPYGHDSMAVYLEGEQVDTITTLAGEVQTLTYSNIAVGDGQLTLRMEDVGGIDANVVINSLAVTRLGADTSSPRVIATSPSGEVTAPIDRIVVDFSKPIDASTFTPVDVVSLTGPDGPITPSAVYGLSETRFEVVFAELFSAGNYEFELGPNIRDLDGRLMDQDQDGVAGETFEDRLAGSFSIAPVTAKFDFGTSISPVASGYDQVLTTTNYSAGLGYGWQSSGLLSVDRGGDPLGGDLMYAPALTFVVDVPDGAYEAILTVGDLGLYAHEAMDVFVEGMHIDSISTSAGEVVTRTYQGVAVVDGQFTLSMVDAGGFDPNVVINGLELRSAGAVTTRVLIADPIPSTSGVVDRVRIVFNSPIDPATFTLADVVELTGPSGPIVPTGVEQVSGNEFDVVFDTQQAEGFYSLTIGPDIAATSGGILDQDGDGTTGEVPEDRFATIFEVSPFTARFDFGSLGSPAEAGYVHVLPWDSYSAEVGYGYKSGLVAAVDRFSGSNLERDIHYGNDFTFSVDVPDGLYSVVLTIGDHGPYAHESMGVFFDGQQINTVSTAPGEVATFTYNDVAVAGGKFELRLLDLGGPDVNAVLAGLELSAHINLAPSEVRNTFSADFDGDGFVTGADFLMWQVGVGTPAPNAVRTDGDADNDLDVDFSDLNVWEQQYGTAAPQVSVAFAPIPMELSSTKSAPELLLTSGELADLALAIELVEDATQEQEPWLGDQPVLADATTDTALTDRRVTPQTLDLIIEDRSDANSSEDEKADVQWLSDELLEQVFG
jgi:fibronectin type 3 domain-containing protein